MAGKKPYHRINFQILEPEVRDVQAFLVKVDAEVTVMQALLRIQAEIVKKKGFYFFRNSYYFSVNVFVDDVEEVEYLIQDLENVFPEIRWISTYPVR